MTFTVRASQFFSILCCLAGLAVAEPRPAKSSTLLQVSTAQAQTEDGNDRESFQQLLQEADERQPANFVSDSADSPSEAAAATAGESGSEGSGEESVSGDDTLVDPKADPPAPPPPLVSKVAKAVSQLDSPLKGPVALKGALFDSHWQSRWVPSAFVPEVSSWGSQKKCAMKVTYKPEGEDYVNAPSGQLKNAKPVPITKLKKKKVKIDMPKIVYKEVEVPVTVTNERFIYQATNKTVTRYVDDVEIRRTNRTVEVPKVKQVDTYVRVVEVPVPTNISQEKVVYKKMKKVVERKVEVPKVTVKKRKVESPVYQEIIKEVPKIEIRQRTIEVVREEIEIVPTNETVSLTQETLVENKVTEKKKKVKVVRESPEMKIEEVEVPQNEVSVVNHEKIHSINMVEHMNITQEVVEIEEEIETVEKVVEVIIEKEEIVEVPTFVTKYIDKEVVLETVREEIVQVPVSKTIEVVKEVPERIFENVSVVLKRDHIATETNLSLVQLVQETVTAKPVKTAVTAKHLIPKPFPISEYTLSPRKAPLQTEGASTNSTQSTDAGTVTEEIIEQEFHEKQQLQTVQVPKITTVTKDVIVPIVEIQEEVVKIPRVRYEEDVIQVPKIYEVENIIEIMDSDCLPEEETPEAQTKKSTKHAKNVSLAQTLKAARKGNQLSSLLASLVKRSQKSAKHTKKSKVVHQAKHLKKNSTHGKVNQTKHLKKNSTHGTHTKPVKSKMNCSGFRIKRVEVPQPNVVTKKIVVPIYEIEEKIVEVPVESEVEEIEEVPVLVNVTTIVEVPQIEYNDTIVEKVVTKRVPEVRQQPVNLSKTKFASRTVEVLEVEEANKTVPMKVQVAKYTPNQIQANSTVTRDTLNLTRKTNEHQIKKKVKVKKRVEKLVPKEVIKTVQKQVKVMKTVSAERVIPIYREKTVQKRVEVESYSVNVVEKPRKLTWQSVKATEEVVTKRVQLQLQQASKQEREKVVELKETLATVVKKTVPIAMPCTDTPHPASKTHNKTIITKIKTDDAGDVLSRTRTVIGDD